MSRSLLLMVTLGVLTLLPRASPHPLEASRYGHVGRPDDTISTKATQIDDILHQGDLAKDDRSQVSRKLSLDNWARLRNILRGVYGLGKHTTTKWQRSHDDDEGTLGATTADMNTGAPHISIHPTVRSTRGGAARSSQVTPMSAGKRSSPLELHMMPPEVVKYVLQGWRDHSARQEALQAALEEAGMRLPTGWRGRDDLSVGLDVEVLKVITADMNRHLRRGHQMNAQNKLARLG